MPLAANHLKARDVGQIQTVGDTRIASFTEDVNLDGVPDALQNIAHNPGNKLSALRQATFVLVNGRLEPAIDRIKRAELIAAA